MNVIYIISGDLWAGAEVQTYSIIHAFAKMKAFRLHVITFNEGILSAKLHGEGISVTILDENKHSMISLISGCLRVMRIYRPDIVHVNGFKENFLGGIAARLMGVSAIVRTHHGKGMIGVTQRYDMIERINERIFTDHIIAVSHDLKRYLVDFGLNAGKITVIHNGIEPCTFMDTKKEEFLRKNLGIEKGDKVIGTVGRLVPIKDHKTFLDGARLILESEPDARFVIVGNGPLMSELEQQACKIGISPNVCFTGFRDDVQEILNLFDVFTLTSIHEGIPIALLEAMGLGKAVVATCVGGVKEVIVDKRTGLFIDSGNPRSLADACIRILRDRDLSASLSEQSISIVKEKFSLDVTIGLTQGLYRRVVQ